MKSAILLAIAALALTACEGSGSQDYSKSIEHDMTRSMRLRAFFQTGQPLDSIRVEIAQCVRSGNTKNYHCIIDYESISNLVPVAQAISSGSHFQIGASATCDDAGACQWQTDSLGSASLS